MAQRYIFSLILACFGVVIVSLAYFGFEGKTQVNSDVQSYFDEFQNDFEAQSKRVVELYPNPMDEAELLALVALPSIVNLQGNPSISCNFDIGPQFLGSGIQDIDLSLIPWDTRVQRSKTTSLEYRPDRLSLVVDLDDTVVEWYCG